MPIWINSLILAITYLIIGLIVTRFLPPIVGRMVLSSTDERATARLSRRRRDTVKGLAVHLTRSIVIAVTAIFIFSIFVNSAGLLTFLGLFSAAFGLGARPLVSDYVSGVVFIFEDQYNIGEKVEIFGVEGTVIDVNLRTTVLRAPSGELYIIPNGEVRVVRNFGRGEFSLASVRVVVQSKQLEWAMAVLEGMAPTLANQISELVEAPKILSEEGTLSERVELTIFAKARFSQGIEARRKLLRIVQEALNQAEIDITTR